MKKLIKKIKSFIKLDKNINMKNIKQADISGGLIIVTIITIYTAYYAITNDAPPEDMDPETVKKIIDAKFNQHPIHDKSWVEDFDKRVADSKWMPGQDYVDSNDLKKK